MWQPMRPSQVARRKVEARARKVRHATTGAALLALAIAINALVETELYQNLMLALS